jgi:hypothetical protein
MKYKITPLLLLALSTQAFAETYSYIVNSDIIERAISSSALSATPVFATFNTTVANFLISGSGGTGTQEIDLSSFGAVIGQPIIVSDFVARGDLNSASETFSLEFNGIVGTGSINTGVQGMAFAPLQPPISLEIDVVDIGDGIAGIVVAGATSTGVSTGSGHGYGATYYFDIASDNL